MTRAEALVREAWLRYWSLRSRTHRYEVEGLHHLEATAPGLIVGYHGRPIAHDLCMLTVAVHERLGYLPHGVLHGAFAEWPLLRTMKRGLDFVVGDGEEMARALARGEHVLVAPGGTREGCRAHGTRYRVDWGERTGYLKLALKYRLPIFPVAASGVDDLYVGLNDGYRLGRALRVPSRLPVWFGLGPVGLWPLSPPFPVKIRQVVGPPIDLSDGGEVDPADRAALLALHRRVTGAVQALLDGLNATHEGASA